MKPFSETPNETSFTETLFSGELGAAETHGIKRSAVTGLTMGLMFGLMYCVYGLGFWYGVKLIMDDQQTDRFDMCTEDCVIADRSHPPEGLTEADLLLDCIDSCFRFNPGTLTTVLFGILQGGMQVGQSATFVEAFNTARAAAANIYAVIKRPSAIDSECPDGQRPSKITGKIEFRDVEFRYPSRPGVAVLEQLRLELLPGKTTALVGPSGCGKSTCVQLIQRLYDPTEGTVTLDGRDLKSLNVGWLREQIGVVGQEPVLFDATIRHNIILGRPTASEADIIAACKEANAYEFIQRLPQGLDTRVGEGGAALSGGQKQRIAIARALVRHPQILLLDEATSALDNESEAIIQVLMAII
jgi:ATP-binding cassette subfamily B (MDR/TAP) protein 1